MQPNDTDTDKQTQADYAARIDGDHAEGAASAPDPASADYAARVRAVPYVSASLTIDEPIVLSCGKSLSGIRVAYDAWGEPNADGSNVILVEHALSGNSHVADAWRDGQLKEGWWNRLVGPGLAIDTERYYVICTNVLGGCSGTTGPMSDDPETGRPYGMSFPVITVKDMVVVQKRFLELLGVERLAAVIGGSLGGMQALVWAKRYPFVVERCIAIATTWRTSAQSIAFNEVGRKAIQSDPKFRNGDYDPADPPAHGLAIARMIGHITYLCEESMNRKFGRQLMGDKIDFTMGREFQVESYLDHQGYKFVDRFDANSYLYITRAIDYFSLCHSQEAIVTRFSDSPVKIMLLAYDSDWLFPASQMRELLGALAMAGVETTYAELECPFGHDSFLLEREQQNAMVRAFLGDVSEEDMAAGAPTKHHRSLGSRADLMAISEYVSEGSRVLDLGCGDGLLLAWLRDNRSCDVYGVDIDLAEVTATMDKEIPVLRHNLDEGLPMFADKSFDVVVLSLALMQVKDPMALVREMLRVGKKIVITFPNFGYWRTRCFLMFKGKMPVGKSLPFSWYETPNIHNTTLTDFREFVESAGGRVESESYLNTRGDGSLKRITFMPNLRSDTVITVASEA